jgi:hypothetical protein
MALKSLITLGPGGKCYSTFFSSYSITIELTIQWDILSFGNPGICKEHLLQIYSPSLSLGPLGPKAQDYCLGSHPFYILGSTDALMSASKVLVGADLY